MKVIIDQNTVGFLADFKAGDILRVLRTNCEFNKSYVNNVVMKLPDLPKYISNTIDRPLALRLTDDGVPVYLYHPVELFYFEKIGTIKVVE